MRTISKFGVVLLGYVAAVLAAAGAVAAYVAATGGPDRVQYDTMYAFGDLLLFLGLLAVASVPATAAALYFLRPVRGFWIALAGLAGLSALICAVSLVDYATMSSGVTAGRYGAVSAFATLRLLLAPCFAIPLLLAGAFAPIRGARVVLLGAGAIDMLAFGYVSTWLATR